MSEWTLPKQLPNLRDAEIISLDIETRDPELLDRGPGVRRDGYIVGIAVGVPEGHRWYLPFAHAEGPQFEPEVIKRWAQTELCRPDQPKLGANLLYDLDYLYHWGVEVTGPFYDVQVAEPLLDENRRMYNLDSLSMEYLGEGKDETLMEQYCEALGLKGKPQGHLWRMPPKFVGPYAEVDVDRPLRVFEEQRRLLRKEGLWDLFILETRLIPLMLAMRQRGVPVDVKATHATRHHVFKKVQEARQEVEGIVGREVNIWANEDIALAFEQLGLEFKRTKKTGAPSFPGWVLEKHPHPIGPLIFEQRRWDKFLSTFLDGHILGNQIDGRIHCQFNQLRGDEYGTVTGRFSSSNPNLQQIPKRDEILGPMCRSLFVPEPGELWARADYSQVELRLLAHYAVGPGSEAIREELIANPDLDYHQICADMSGIARSSAKHINFGVVYGMGVKKLCDKLGLDEIEGKALMNAYHAKMPFMKETSNAASRTANKRGNVHTIMKRRRRFPDWEPADFNLSWAFRDTDVPRDPVSVRAWIKEQVEKAREKGHRVPRMGIKRAWTYRALNAVIQGSAADVMKKAMVDIWESGVCDVLGAPLLTVHDELDWSIPKTKEGIEAFHESVRIMETTIPFRVPLKADPEIMKNWGTDLTDEERRCILE
jgi:DNA polymerase I-like protein with 3'-5' exonuclease and polymerase domains